jgi:hypothetical protein
VHPIKFKRLNSCISSCRDVSKLKYVGSTVTNGDGLNDGSGKIVVIVAFENCHQYFSFPKH